MVTRAGLCWSCRWSRSVLVRHRGKVGAGPGTVLACSHGVTGRHTVGEVPQVRQCSAYIYEPGAAG